MPIYIGSSDKNQDQISAFDKNIDFVFVGDKLVWVKKPCFISTWKTDNPGISNSNQIKLPLVFNGTYNFIAYWGDGTSSTITSYNQSEITHSYETAGTKTVKIMGVCHGWQFAGICDNLKILNISNWGAGFRLGNTNNHFYNCSNLTITANDALDLTGCSSLSYMFYGCTNFNSDISNWDVSNITNMEGMFMGCSIFNKSLNAWNVGSVTNMDGMFYGCTNFNSNISSWNTGSVVKMDNMFRNCTSFNSDISGWDVSNVTSMSTMFNAATSFNRDLNSWDVSKVTSMNSMLGGCTSFNGNVTGWEVTSLLNASDLFYGCTSFNQDIGTWSIGSVINMSNMLYNTGLSVANYSNILIGWSTQTVNSGISFSANPTKYNTTALSARLILINSPNNWDIIDGGLE